MTSKHEMHILGDGGEPLHLATCKCGTTWSYDDGDFGCPNCDPQVTPA